jgi:hypothetical protein
MGFEPKRQRNTAVGEVALSVAKTAVSITIVLLPRWACHKSWPPCETALSTAQFCV